ncbi:MAG: DUF1540 domain-containing protein [Clostridia bacterium]|nr:DUF1540 domain-containing protein [Clostridia bacterium]
MNIVCRKTKCKYNNNQVCMSPKIFIDRELNCEQYEPIEKGSLQDVSRNMMEVAPEIAPFRNSKDIIIRCNANCVFNKESECMANGIFVNGQTVKANKKVDTIVKDDEVKSDKTKKKGGLFRWKKNAKNANLGDERAFGKPSTFNENFENYKIKEACACNDLVNGDFNETSSKSEIKIVDLENDNPKKSESKEKESGQAKCFTFANK